MDLHLHLSVAFRALDKKWGTAVDLDSTEEASYGFPCLPAMIDRPATTFSSEEFLRTRRKRSKPYSRYQERRRKDNVKTNDSFADISSTRLPLSETEATSVDSGLDQESTVTRLVEELTRSEGSSLADSLVSLNSISDRRMDNVLKPYLKQWKDTAISFIEKRCKRKRC